MRLITSEHGQLRTLFSRRLRQGQGLFTGLPHVDVLFPAGLPRGGIHEVLSAPQHAPPLLFALALARAALCDAFPSVPSCLRASVPSSQVMICCDARIYPPALVDLGFDLDRIYLLHPADPDDLIWAMSECLRCPGVAVVLATPPPLSRIQARRLQLAAETGGGVGLLLRPHHAVHYAAATRWLVSPAPGQRTVQRWKIQLIHCHGGITQTPFFLEHCRETHRLRTAEQLVHRQTPSQAASLVADG